MLKLHLHLADARSLADALLHLPVTGKDRTIFLCNCARQMEGCICLLITYWLPEIGQFTDWLPEIGQL